jgi:hypothetical protein
MYSVIKCNKEFILSLDSKKQFIEKIQENSIKEMRMEQFVAFAYLKSWKTTSGYFQGFGAKIKFN